jgi:hypothetical protein
MFNLRPGRWSYIAIGMLAGLTCGAAIGFVAAAEANPPAMIGGMFILGGAAFGLTTGATAGAIGELVVRLAARHRRPADGPEADYDEPDSSGRSD